MKSEQEAKLAIDKYADTVRRICFVHLKNYHDVEDIFQDVFLKYLLCEKEFMSDEHEKAWLIRVTINACKDTLKSFFRKKVSSLEELVTEPHYIEEDNREVLEAILQLPDKYKTVIYLHYYEGYTVVEIAAILGKNQNTVYSWLSRAKTQLRERLGGEPFGQQDAQSI